MDSAELRNSTLPREWTQEQLLEHAAKWLKERPASLADTLSVLQCLTGCAESCLGEELEAVFGDYDHFTFDYYDMSFEVYGVSDSGLNPEQQQRFWSLGFRRFWTHEHPTESRQPGERSYGKR